MGRLLPADERASVPDDALGDAIASAVTKGVSERYARALIHVHSERDRILDAQLVTDSDDCSYCDALSDDDPAAATDY